MKYLPIAILSSILLIFCSCNDRRGSDDKQRTTNYIYSNQTGASLALEYHYAAEENGSQVAKSKRENIDTGKSHSDVMVIPGAKSLILIGCDSVRIVFNNVKELWYYRTKEMDKKGNPFQMANYTITKKSTTETDCLYNINEELFDLAGAIE